jgi:ubiquinone/menaquinone biosynthesis C-methylase UbiE
VLTQIDFPWASLPNGAVINDIGGGTGTVLLELAKEYPHLQLILQDLPDQIEIARAELWPKEYPKALED